MRPVTPHLLLLLALPAALAAQITSRVSGVPCAQLAEPPPSPRQIDSLQQRHPDTDADSAFAGGEHRLWAANYGADIPGTLGSVDSLFATLLALGDIDSTARPQVNAALDRFVSARAALQQSPGVRTFPNTGHMLVFCTRPWADGTLERDTGDAQWHAAAAEYATAYNRRMLRLLGRRGP